MGWYDLPVTPDKIIVIILMVFQTTVEMPVQHHVTPEFPCRRQNAGSLLPVLWLKYTYPFVSNIIKSETQQVRQG